MIKYLLFYSLKKIHFHDYESNQLNQMSDDVKFCFSPFSYSFLILLFEVFLDPVLRCETGIEKLKGLNKFR